MSQFGKGKLLFLEGGVEGRAEEIKHAQVRNAEVGLTIPSTSFESAQDVSSFSGKCNFSSETCDLSCRVCKGCCMQLSSPRRFCYYVRQAMEQK